MSRCFSTTGPLFLWKCHWRCAPSPTNLIDSSSSGRQPADTGKENQTWRCCWVCLLPSIYKCEGPPPRFRFRSCTTSYMKNKLHETLFGSRGRYQKSNTCPQCQLGQKDLTRSHFYIRLSISCESRRYPLVRVKHWRAFLPHGECCNNDFAED